MAADHPYVDLERTPGADRFDLAVLEHPQHLRLGAQAHVADLVEENGAAVGLDELADLPSVGAGERALLVPEQLRLDQLARDCRAVDANERPPRPLGQVVQAARHELLAGPRLTLDEDRRVGGRRPGDLLAQGADRGASSEQRRRLLGRGELASHPALGHRAAHREQQVGAVGRLGEVGGGPGVEHLLGGELVAVAGQHHDRDLEAAMAEVGDQAEPVHARHLEVEQGGVRGLGVEQVERLKGVARLLNGVPGRAQDPPQHRADPGVVIDDQNAAFHAAHTIQFAARIEMNSACRAPYTSNLTPWASGSSLRPVDGAGLAAHVGLPGVGARLAAAAGLLLAAEGAADLGARGADVDVGDAAVASPRARGTSRPRAGSSVKIARREPLRHVVVDARSPRRGRRTR